MADLLKDLEKEAKARFVRFDFQLWQKLIAGPVQDLERSLQANVPSERATRLREIYLRLGFEAIGLGYLFPESAGQNFFALAWNNLIPRSLALLPAHKQGQALANCWNLGENLERSPAWLRRIALRLASGVDSLGQLEALVARIGEALAEPQAKLKERARITWVRDLAEDDRRFLPGALHFVAPTVVCVHDRHRTAAAGGDAVTVGVWLAEEPLTLGAMGCEEKPAGLSDRLDLVEQVQQADPLAADVLNSAANDWRCALTLETSQFLVAMLPSARA